MQHRSLLLLAILAPMVSAKKLGKEPMRMGDISATSKLGNKLLSSARRLNDNNERDYTWVSGYSIRFKSCTTVTTVPTEEGGGEEGQTLMNNDVVVFQLCPTSTCGEDSCSDGAEYAVSMAQFVQAYSEYKMESQQYTCEMIREYCYCDNANDEDACEYQCYIDADAEYCIQYQDEDFDIERFMECEAMENNEMYYLGVYCASGGKAILLGVFDDPGCVSHSDDGLYMYEKYNYRALPYSTESLVEFDCISCMEQDENNNQNNNNNNNNGNNNNNNNNNQNQENRLNEMCERLYEVSAKCESGLGNPSYSSYWYPDDTACDYIQNTLPKLDRVFNSRAASMGVGGGSPAKALAVVFGISTLALAGVSYWLYTKVQRTSVDLSAQGGTTA